MEEGLWYRLAGWTALTALLTGYAGGALMHVSPYPIQRLLQSRVADAGVMTLALVTAVSLTWWSRRRDRPDRRTFVAAIGSAGVLAVIINLIAPAAGWWGGRVFDAPRLPLALLTGLRVISILGLLLLLYRWLAARRQWLALLAYGVILVALVPATIAGDPILLRSGALTFGGGYTIWHDLLLGELFFVLPPALYTLLRRVRQSRVALQRKEN